MTKKILVAISILLLLILGLLIYFYITKDTDVIDNNTQKDTNNNDIGDKDTTNDTFILEKEYVSQNSWEYRITGQLPNPCYSATVDVLVAESYPEQVTVLVKIVQPQKDIMCAQVISDFEYEGTFSASEQATVTLKVE